MKNYFTILINPIKVKFTNKNINLIKLKLKLLFE